MLIPGTLRCRDYQRKQFYIFIKEIADRLASLVALSLLSPLMLIVALLVRWRLNLLFFCQKRPGYLGKAFWLIKFRTMRNTRDASGICSLILRGLRT